VQWLKKTDLKQLILILASLSMLVTVFNMFYASAVVHRKSLMDGTLQHNAGYADKLAQTIEVLLAQAQQELIFTAIMLGNRWQEQASVDELVDKLYAQNSLFNSIYVSDAGGNVSAASINARDLVGSQLVEGEYGLALQQQRAWVSAPFICRMGNLVTMLTAPVFDTEGSYLGYVSASFYLQHNNVLQRLIGQHYQQDGSYIYIIDNKKRLLYHLDSNRIGEQVETNPILDLVLSGNPGSGQVINSKGVSMLAGYAHIPLVDWGLVAQSPTEAVLQKHYSVMRKVMLQSLPISITLLLAIWLFSGLIARPLRLLAVNAMRLTQRTSIGDVKEIPAWFHEAEQLRKAMLFGLERMHDKVDQLQHDVDIDPLTGLNNRRVLAPQLAIWQRNKTAFCALMLDIDHFKKINDEFGHGAGDSVLQELGHLLLQSSRGNDVSIRMGGEEFLILMDSCNMEVGERVAERLRCRVMEHEFKDVGQVTISIGVATWPDGYATPEDCVRRADEMLYRAKDSGRNRVCSHRQCIS